MANWYDWIPGVSNLAGAVKGDFSQAALGPLATGYDYFYGDPANDVKKAYDEAMGQTEQRSGRIRDFLMGQQQQALGYYKPVQGMFQNAYGSGLQPQQTPRMGGR